MGNILLTKAALLILVSEDSVAVVTELWSIFLTALRHLDLLVPVLSLGAPACEAESQKRVSEENKPLLIPFRAQPPI